MMASDVTLLPQPDSQGAATRQREVDAVDGVDGSIVGGEGDSEAAQLQQRPGHRRAH
jgi:hypothetical protein